MDDQTPYQRLTRLMTEAEASEISLQDLSSSQQEALLKWGMRMFGLGRYPTDDIEEIKYEGRLIILADGSRWAVDPIDAGIAEFWNSFEKVVVIDDVMYRLEGAEHVAVEEELD